jgi:hypothetical protein
MAFAYSIQSTDPCSYILRLKHRTPGTEKAPTQTTFRGAHNILTERSPLSRPGDTSSPPPIGEYRNLVPLLTKFAPKFSTPPPRCGVLLLLTDGKHGPWRPGVVKVAFFCADTAAVVLFPVPGTGVLPARCESSLCRRNATFSS